MTHTKEPWVTSGLPGAITMDCIVGEGDEIFKGGDELGAWCDPDNARRIVACVNACEGIPTDELELVGKWSQQLLRLTDLAETCVKVCRKIAMPNHFL